MKPGNVISHPGKSVKDDIRALQTQVKKLEMLNLAHAERYETLLHNYNMMLRALKKISTIIEKPTDG